MASLRTASSALAPEPGERLGSIVADGMHALFRGIGPPPTPTVRRNLVVETAAFVHETIRLGFSQATLTDTYLPLTVTRDWYAPDDWEALTQTVEALSPVVRDLSEALRLLARASVTDDRLLAMLSIAAGAARALPRGSKGISRGRALGWFCTGRRLWLKGDGGLSPGMS
jgi:hypothetical protein